MKNLFLIATLVILISSCGKDEYFDFTEDELTDGLYYTYNTGDTIKFLHTPTNDTLITIVKKDLFYKERYSYSTAKYYSQNILIELKDLENKNFISIKKSKGGRNYHDSFSIQFKTKQNFYETGNKDTVKIKNYKYSNCTFYTYSQPSLKDTLFLNIQYGILMLKDSIIKYQLIRDL